MVENRESLVALGSGHRTAPMTGTMNGSEFAQRARDAYENPVIAALRRTEDRQREFGHGALQYAPPPSLVGRRRR